MLCVACIASGRVRRDHVVGSACAPLLARPTDMITPSFDDSPPASTGVTPYDERHFVTYLRLLDAATEGADWRDAVRIVFGLDPAREPERARTVHDSHLARARWMTETGYRHLLQPPPN